MRLDFDLTNHPSDDVGLVGIGGHGALSIRDSVIASAEADDLHAVLAALNARARFRFTGLYAVEGIRLRNVGLFDRENPAVEASGDVCALADTYCGLVESTACAFTTFDARSDARLVTHPARRRVVSYAGVPLRASSGNSGTICYWDSRPRLLPGGELSVLEDIAPLLVRFLTSRTPS